MVLRDGEGVLQICGRFDHGGDEAGGDVPFDMAVEEPDAWRTWRVSLDCNSYSVVKARQGKGWHLSGLSALKRMTKLPWGRTIKTSLRIGTFGNVSLPT